MDAIDSHQEIGKGNNFLEAATQIVAFFISENGYTIRSYGQRTTSNRDYGDYLQ